MAHFRTGYMDKALFDLKGVVRRAIEDLEPVADQFDTLVGTGFSGGIVVPTLAMRMQKNFVLIRKETDDSHHGPGKVLGYLGERWIFVDDFISSGRTRERVMKKISEAALFECQSTTFAGQYCYAALSGETFWTTAEELDLDDDDDGEIIPDDEPEPRPIPAGYVNLGYTKEDGTTGSLYQGGTLPATGYLYRDPILPTATAMQAILPRALSLKGVI